jgi:hyperosmotically inducible protein
MAVAMGNEAHMRPFFTGRHSMKSTFLTLVVLAFAGCDEGKSTASKAAPAAPDGTAVKRDNTEVNVRDRTDAAKTPIDQNENQKDIDITANIRKRVVDTKMSVNAQNIKIVTQDGKVTLRGPVKSDDEKAQIEKMAHDVAGAANVDNQLEVQP